MKMNRPSLKHPETRSNVSFLQKGVSAACLAVLLATVPMMAVAETSITLATYNIHVGVPMGEGIGQYQVTTTDLDAITSVIRECGADIVALQEVDCEYGLGFPARRRSSLLNEARYIAAGLSDKCYIFGSAQDDTGYPTDNGKYVEWGSPDKWTNNGEAHGEVGNALLWNIQWSKAGVPDNIELPKDAGQERRSCIYTRLLVPSGASGNVEPVNIYATHLQHDSGLTRYKQMDAILRHTADRGDELVFILGDLNHELDATETSNPISLALDRGFHDLAAPAEGESDVSFFTFPADNPDRRIDFILCNKPVQVLVKKVLRSLASDHLPVVVTVTW